MSQDLDLSCLWMHLQKVVPGVVGHIKQAVWPAPDAIGRAACWQRNQKCGLAFWCGFTERVLTTEFDAVNVARFIAGRALNAIGKQAFLSQGRCLKQDLRSSQERGGDEQTCSSGKWEKSAWHGNKPTQEEKDSFRAFHDCLFKMKPST